MCFGIQFLLCQDLEFYHAKLGAQKQNRKYSLSPSQVYESKQHHYADVSLVEIKNL